MCCERDSPPPPPPLVLLLAPTPTPTRARQRQPPQLPQLQRHAPSPLKQLLVAIITTSMLHPYTTATQINHAGTLERNETLDDHSRAAAVNVVVKSLSANAPDGDPGTFVTLVTL